MIFIKRKQKKNELVCRPATQQLTGRRTSSLKASLEAINLGLQTHDFSIGGELATAAQSALAASSLQGAMGVAPGT